MRFAFPGVFFAICLSASSAQAQSTVPTVTTPLPNQVLPPGGAAVTVDVRNHFTVPGLVGTQFARFDTVAGRFSVELRGDAAPRHVANFLSYVQSNAYTNSFFHRAASLDGTTVSILQGGGYRVPVPVTTIPKLAPVPLEYNLANSRGTLAAARTSEINSATSEWYFNIRDNSNTLGPSNGGGYTVFGRVLGTGMQVVDTLAAFPRIVVEPPFTELPVRNYVSGNPTQANLLVINSVVPATLFPTGGGASVIELAIQNSAPTVVGTTLSGSTLTITPLSSGTASITVRAIDTNGNAAESTFSVAVSASPPVFVSQPTSQTVATGTTVVFNAPAISAASYRWERDGVEVGGATSGILVINNATAGHAGRYTVTAANSFGSVTSGSATLAVVNTAAPNVGRLVNLSILTTAGSGSRVLTMGAVVGAGAAGQSLPLVIRGIGPTLGQPPFNIPGVLGDPVMTFFQQGNDTPIDSNDNWGGTAALSAAFRSVAAFDLPVASLDSAIVRTGPGMPRGNYTVQVTGKGNASGLVIAELYDAAGTSRDGNTPRLINLSTLTAIDAGADLAVGFVLGGTTARTVLVRGIGPSLSRFNVDGLMADPRLELFNNDSGQRIGSNDDWSGSLEIATVSASVGAFPLVSPASKDAVMVVTLPPGAYSARVAGAGNTGGTAIIEVYEVN